MSFLFIKWDFCDQGSDYLMLKSTLLTTYISGLRVACLYGGGGLSEGMIECYVTCNLRDRNEIRGHRLSR